MAICFDPCCPLNLEPRCRRRLKLLLAVVVVAAVIIAVVVIIGFVVIHHVKASVEDARLNSFAFVIAQSGETTTSILVYNISVALIVRNPNWAMSIKHNKPLVAAFIFHDRRLGNVTVADRGHKQRRLKTDLHLLGPNGEVPSYALGVAAVEDFKKQNETGVFTVEMRLSGEITYLGFAIDRKQKLTMSCLLNLQLAPPGPEVVVFRKVNCKPDEPDKVYF